MVLLTDTRPDLAAQERAMNGNRDEFERLVEPYRHEIQLHCYRMLGSLHDAEDLTQETLLRAWRGHDRFEGRASVRNWLYTIATNACLNALNRSRYARRVLPETQGPPAVQPHEGGPAGEVAWLDPYPDAWLEDIADTAPGPEARYEQAEAVRLAFVAAIQHLPPRQRAVLLLRDVLAWSAGETAGLLDTSATAVNSALQRARATLAQRLPAGEPSAPAPPEERQRALLARYVRAWEGADLDGLVALLRDDAVLRMPPMPQWYRGRVAIRGFLAWAWPQASDGPSRLVRTAANQQPAFAHYVRDTDAPEWRAHALWLPTFQGDEIAILTGFIDARIFVAFDLPAVLPLDSDVHWAARTG